MTRISSFKADGQLLMVLAGACRDAALANRREAEKVRGEKSRLRRRDGRESPVLAETLEQIAKDYENLRGFLGSLEMMSRGCDVKVSLVPRPGE